MRTGTHPSTKTQGTGLLLRGGRGRGDVRRETRVVLEEGATVPREQERRVRAKGHRADAALLLSSSGEGASMRGDSSHRDHNEVRRRRICSVPFVFAPRRTCPTSTCTNSDNVGQSMRVAPTSPPALPPPQIGSTPPIALPLLPIVACQIRQFYQVITGAASGHLYVWSGRNCVRSIRGHYGAVTALFSGPYGLISGGKVRSRSCLCPQVEACMCVDVGL